MGVFVGEGLLVVVWLRLWNENIVGVVGGVGCEAHFSVGETARAICITNR